MSKVITCSKPLRLAIAAAPTTPPAGPDSTVRTGWRDADSSDVMPAARLHHEDARCLSLAHTALPHSRVQALQITLHDGLQVRVDHHRAGALVLAELRQYQMGERQWQTKFLQYTADCALVVGISEREQRRDCDRFRSAGVDVARQQAEVLPRGSLQHFAIAAYALRHAEPHCPFHQRRHALKRKVVKLRSSLPSDLDSVFESSRGNERHARAFALQQSVGAHGRAV